MSNANRDYAIVYDVKNSSLALSRPLVFYITDKNTSNIFVKLVTRVSIGNEIDRYTDIENASNYVLTMRVIKPSNEVKSIEATQHEEESIFQFDLTEDFKDIPGKYTCELTISTIVSSRQELITSDPFSYEVKRSILSNVGEIIETEDTTVEKLLNDLNTTKAELSSQIKENTKKLEKITTFDVFPDDDVLNSLPMNYTFEVKGFYKVGDMPKCLYQKVGYAENSIKKTTYYIKPITDDDSTLFLPYIGIRCGADYSVQNSNIIAKTDFKFGSVLKLPTGDYYFDRPIKLEDRQLSLIGECMSFTSDFNTKGITILVFENLAESEKAISVGTGTLSNITVRGNKDHYNYYIDREKTYIDRENIEKETCVVKCYGIFGGAITNITNVHVEYFYYGCYLNTGNIYITDFYARKCHIGLSIGGDTKCKGVYGWDIHTLLQMRSSISSVVQVRADSCRHLIHLINYSSGIQLTDLDGDYCVGSLIKVGVYDEWGSVKDVVINGITGRACCINCYDSSKDEVPTSAKVTNESDVSNWGLISVENKTDFDGVVVNMANSNISSNPHDRDSTLRTPPILIASAGVCYAIFNTTFKNGYGQLGEIDIKRQTLLDSVALLSNKVNSTRICLNTPSGAYYLHKQNPVTIHTKKQVTEILD